MRIAGLVAFMAACASVIGPAPPRSIASTVVVAELFTSEGCSSCPPADAILSGFGREPVDGVTVLTLSEHVDYWDRLGWRDPFSSAAVTQRQSDYAARAFHSDNIYTPQLVIDGHLQAVGSDAAAARRLIAEAARAPKALVQIDAARDGRDVVVTVKADMAPLATSRGNADVVVALVEDRLQNNVLRGENEGRTLAHDAVVRVMKSAGSVNAAAPSFTGTVKLAWSDGWKPSDLRAIAFVQDKKTLRIVGAGGAALR